MLRRLHLFSTTPNCIYISRGRVLYTTMAEPQALSAAIAEQTQRLNDLRLSKVQDQAAVDEAKKKLSELKKTLGELKRGAAGPKEDIKKRERLLLKTAKGTRDFGPSEMALREHIENVVKDCFKRYGGSCLDTPVFERKDVLTDKYGEDSKLIFDLADQGGEELALRYDHTVPLARYLAMSTASFTGGKLWQIGKVYRRDNPVVSKGRMREFQQADFDISGVYDLMIPDAEIISLLCDILTRLKVGEFTIKLNHRKILDGIFSVCGVPVEKIRSISSAVDKLDKLPWADVRKEMTEEKGLDGAVADKIGEYAKLKGSKDLLEKLEADALLMADKVASEGIKEMKILFGYLDVFKVTDKMSFDLSLARGLDYYTGIIYEAIVAASAPPGFSTLPAVSPTESTTTAAPTAPPPAPKKKAKKSAEDDEDVDDSQVGVGSIAAGGRYDNLVGAFTAAASAEGKKAAQIPCVGVSIGVDRIFALLWPQWTQKERTKDTLVYVMAAGDGLLLERMKLVKELRDAGIKTDFTAKNKPKLPTQFAASEKDEVPFAIILGESELKEGMVTVKEQRWETVEGVKQKVVNTSQGEKVERAKLIEFLKSSEGWQRQSI